MATGQGTIETVIWHVKNQNTTIDWFVKKGAMQEQLSKDEKVQEKEGLRKLLIILIIILHMNILSYSQLA